jgi:hypothetical protein
MHLQRSARRSITLFLFTAATARAQTTAGASLGTLLQHAPGAQWQTVSALWQSGQIDTRWTQFTGDGRFVGSGRGSIQLDNLDFQGSFSPAPIGRVRWSNVAELSGARGALGEMRIARRVESAASVAAFGGGAWLGGGAEEGRDIDDGAVKPLLSFGFWRPFGRTSFSVTSSSRVIRLRSAPSRIVETQRLDSIFNDTTGRWEVLPRRIVTGDSTGTSRDVRWTEVEARLAWASNRVALEMRVGARPRLAGTAASSWARVTTTVALAPRLALVAAAGNESALTSSLAARTPFLSLGLRVAPAALARPRPPAHVRPVANAFRVLPADSGHYRVVVNAPSARTLELSGDFDGWRPVSLAQTEPDEWEVTLAVTPGTYRVNMRVNGDRWTAPPGLPTADDEFNGTVGLLVVR